MYASDDDDDGIHRGVNFEQTAESAEPRLVKSATDLVPY